MADEQNVATEENGAKKKSKLKLIIILSLALLLLAGGGGAAYFFLLGDSGEQQAEEAKPAETKEAVRARALYTKVRTMEGKPMFVVSLRSDDGRPHYLQAYVEAKSRDQAVEDALKLHMPLVVSRLNNLFATQSFNVLQTQQGKRDLQELATNTVREVMMERIGKPGVEIVLFTNFVMQ